MCGFAGVTWWGGSRPTGIEAIVDRMVSTIDHRGPDSDGLIDAAGCRVGFKRLAIVDLTTGDQPVSNEDGTVEVLLNGEIFNHRELRRSLERAGHRFRTQGDAEIIPHLYEEHGPDFVQHLNGMFAICLIDHTQKRTLLYRDRIGIKPLFVARAGDAVAFGSELKTIVAGGMVEPEVDPSQLLMFLGNFCTAGRETLLQGVERLLPGEMMEIRAGHPTRRHRYYQVPVTPAAEATPPDLEALDALLADAVELRLMADVPVGISLSGGLDSSLITMYAARAERGDLNLFTVHFEGTPRDELECAQDVARQFGLRHETLSASTDSFLAEAPATFWMCDEPVADPAYFSASKVADAAASMVKVLLSGTGADEIFAGYGHHTLTPKKLALSRLPRGLLRSRALTPLLRRALRADEVEPLQAYRDDRLPWHLRALSSLDPASSDTLAAHLGTARPQADALRAAYARAAKADPLNRQLFGDIETYLPDQLLPVLDRSTMGASIEGRVPFLDHRVVEMAMGIAGPAKLGGGQERKAPLRSLARGHLPDRVLDRPKLGFPNAVQLWLDNGLDTMLPHILASPDSLVDQYLPKEWVSSLVATPAACRANWRLAYGLLVLQVWHEVLVRSPRSSAPQESLSELFSVPTSR